MSDEPAVRLEVRLPDPDATASFGFALGRHMRAGQAIALCGDLGAGKTCTARGIARGLGVDDPDAVTSPTYLIAIEHAGSPPMIHVDAYLPEKTRAFLLDGGVDYLAETGAVIVAEWADRIRDLLPAETLWVQITPDGGGGRLAILEGGPKFLWVKDFGGDAESGPINWESDRAV